MKKTDIKMHLFLYTPVISYLLLCISACNPSKDKVSTNMSIDSKKEEENMTTSDINIVDIGNLDENTMFVIMGNGVELKQTQDKSSNEILKLPLGEKLELLERPAINDVKDKGLVGGMARVRYGKSEGYIFDAYLSSLPPLSFCRKHNFYKEGDLSLYTDFLRKLGFMVYLDKQDLETIFLPINSLQETFLIAKIIFPGFLGQVDLIRENSKPQQLGIENEYELIERPKSRPEWDREVELYRTVRLSEEDDLELMDFYFIGGSGKQVNITLKKSNGKCSISFSEYRR